MICLRESCDREFLRIQCPYQKKNEITGNTTKASRIPKTDFRTTESPSQSESFTSSTSTPPLITTTEQQEIENSGDSFSEDEIEDENFRCQPNKSFKLSCNTCWCRSDGEGPKYCTRVACNPKTSDHCCSKLSIKII